MNALTHKAVLLGIVSKKKKRVGKLHLHLKKGALHQELGYKPGFPIPVARLRKAAQSGNALLRKRAQFALNAKGWHHG